MSPRLNTMTAQKVMVRRVTRSSPDSDDTFSGECDDGMMMGANNDFPIRDDQFLIADRLENKFYGSVHGGSTTPNILSTGPCARIIQAIANICPSMFPWVNPGPATSETGMYVVKLVGIMFGLIFVMDLTAAAGSGTFAIIVITLTSLAIVAILILISKQPQNRHALAFLTPGLPVVPTIAVLVNIYLIMKLSILTLVRFTVWMSLGIIMYFYYGISHSNLEQSEQKLPEEDISGQTKTQNKFASPINVYSNHMANVDLNGGWGDEPYTLSNASSRLEYDNRAFEGSHFGVIDASSSSKSPFNAWDD